MTETRLRGRVRWSACARCARWGALGLRGADPEPPDDRTQRLWTRGKQLGAYMAERYVEKYGADNVILEKAVPWPPEGLPLGELHPDIFIVPERMAVEVKSTTAPSSMIESAFTQLAGQVHFDPEAERGALVLVDPSDLEETHYPFVLTDKWRARVEEIAAQVAAAVKGATLPPCSFETPGECRAHGCPFTTVAWEAWRKPDPTIMDGEVAQLAADLYRAEQRLKEAQTIYVGEAKRERDELRGRLAELIEPGQEVEAGGVMVKLTLGKERETFSLAAARKSGVWGPGFDELLGPFVKVGDPTARWTVKRIGQLEPEDFGEEMPA